MAIFAADNLGPKVSVPRLRYQQAMDFIENGLQSGKYIPGQKLPPMKEISHDLGMNFLTVRRALRELAGKGIIRIKHGSGTFIADQPLRLHKKTVRIAMAYRSFMMDLGETHPALGAYLVGVHQRCKPLECVVQSLFYKEETFTRDIGQALLDEQINGVVVFDERLTDEDFKFLQDHRIHAVCLSQVERENEWAIIVMNDRQWGLSQAVEHLRGLGHRRIGMISYTYTTDKGGLLRHFAKLAFEHRLGDPKELLALIGDPPSGEIQWQDVETFFRIDPLPTAVMVNDEFLADVLLDGCERRGIKVPDDLSVVVLQDARPLGHRIPLTAVLSAEDLSHMANLACELLIKRINGQTVQSHIVYRPKMAIKASSGPVNRKGE